MATLAICLAFAASGAQGARTARKTGSIPSSKFILGDVPILNYHRAFKNEASLSETDAAEADWVVVMKPEASEEQIHKLCAMSNCLEEGHPRSGGMPYFEVRSTESELETLLREADGLVQLVEPDYTVSLEQELTEQVLTETAASSGNWNLDRIGTKKRSSTGAGTHIYILDSGIRKSHDDFEGRVVPTLDKTRQRNQKCVRWSPLPCAADYDGHGSHVAGIAGGATYGVAPGATLHAMKVMDEEGQGKASWAYDALDFIATQGLRPGVASMSVGSRGTDSAMKTAVDTAVTAGITVVVASGNFNVDACRYSPAFVPNAITVGSTDSKDKKSYFSNYGACTDIWAPGSDTRSASFDADDSWYTKSGTDYAAPHVSGAAALLLEKAPNSSPAKVLSKLLKKAANGVLSGLTADDTNKLLQVS